MANFKHKVFLLIAKWIPVAVAAGILINNTLAMLDVKDVILDLFDITVGSSLAFVIMMYACSIGSKMKMQVVIRFGNILGLFNGLL